MSAPNQTFIEALPSDWPNRLPADFYVALDQLNQGEYFACHETLEALWIPERQSIREIYQGVLQIAVGCYHLTVRTNWVGAVNKLDAGRLRLERAGLLRDHAGSRDTRSGTEDTARGDLYGVDWRRLLANAERLANHLRALGQEHVADFDRSLLPTVLYKRP